MDSELLQSRHEKQCCFSMQMETGRTRPHLHDRIEVNLELLELLDRRIDLGLVSLVVLQWQG